jgi:hypothetical protein
MSADDRAQLEHIATWGGLTDPDSLTHLGESGFSLAYNIQVQRPDLLAAHRADPGMLGAALLIGRLRELFESVDDRKIWTLMTADVINAVIDEWETGRREQGPWKEVWDDLLVLGKSRGYLSPIHTQMDGESSAELSRYSAGLESGAIPMPRQQPKSGGCYVASAVYGSYDCPEVRTLRRFRDQVLARSTPGRVFVKAYYATSPVALRWFQPSESGPLRRALDSLVASLQRRGYSGAAYVDEP